MTVATLAAVATEWLVGLWSIVWIVAYVRARVPLGRIVGDDSGSVGVVGHPGAEGGTRYRRVLNRTR